MTAVAGADALTHAIEAFMSGVRDLGIAGTDAAMRLDKLIRAQPIIPSD